MYKQEERRELVKNVSHLIQDECWFAPSCCACKGSDVQRQSTRPAEGLERQPTPFPLQRVRPTRQHVAYSYQPAATHLSVRRASRCSQLATGSRNTR